MNNTFLGDNEYRHVSREFTIGARYANGLGTYRLIQTSPKTFKMLDETTGRCIDTKFGLKSGKHNLATNRIVKLSFFAKLNNLTPWSDA